MKKANKATILGLLRAVADQALDDNLPPSRIRNKYRQLRKAVDKNFQCIIPLSREQEVKAWWNISEFGRRSGWEGQRKHLGTILSLLLGIMDRYEDELSDRITDILCELVEHLENRKRFLPACYWAGDEAVEILHNIMEENNDNDL